MSSYRIRLGSLVTWNADNTDNMYSQETGIVISIDNRSTVVFWLVTTSSASFITQSRYDDREKLTFERYVKVLVF